MEKVKKLTVAEIMQSIEVSKLPLVIHNNRPCRIYKLMVKLKQPRHVSLRNCQETLRTVFLRALEDAIERHVALLSRINGIKSVKSSKAESSSAAEDDDDAVVDKADDDDDDDDDDIDETAEDLGSEFNKRKRQATDSVDYEDGSEEEEESSEFESEAADQANAGAENGTDYETDGERPAEEQEQVEDVDKANTKSSEEFVERKFDRAIFLEVKNLNLEVHFRFTNEPEILLAEVALKLHKCIAIWIKVQMTINILRSMRTGVCVYIYRPGSGETARRK